MEVSATGGAEDARCRTRLCKQCVADAPLPRSREKHSWQLLEVVQPLENRLCVWATCKGIGQLQSGFGPSGHMLLCHLEIYSTPRNHFMFIRIRSIHTLFRCRRRSLKCFSQEISVCIQTNTSNDGWGGDPKTTEAADSSTGPTDLHSSRDSRS